MPYKFRHLHPDPRIKRKNLVKDNRRDVPIGMRRCTRCREAKPLDRSHFGRKSKRHWSSWCIRCIRDYARVRAAKDRREHPEKIRASKRAYAQSERGKKYKRSRSALDNHARRQRHRGKPIQWRASDWRRARLFFGDRCAYCDGERQLTQDHFIPISHPQFPGTIRGNIVPACQPCNSSKCDSDPFIWVADGIRLNRIVSFLSIERARANKRSTKSLSQPALF